MYNGEFRQCLAIIIRADEHRPSLEAAKVLKKQCDAWYFNVQCDEHKSARKGPVLERNLMIYQTAYASDIVIFKEAIRRICYHLDLFWDDIQIEFTDRGAEPLNDLRNRPR